MNIREADKKKDVPKGNEREEGKKPGKMLDALKSIGATPLKSTIMAVATTAVLGCGSSLSTGKDAEEDAETDAPLVANMPRPPMEVHIPLPRDSETEDDAVEDVVEDGEADVPGDAVEEEGYCSAVNASRTTSIRTGNVTIVGGVGVGYNGLDTEGNGVFDIVCEDVVATGDIHIPEGESRDIDMEGFRVTITPTFLNDEVAGVNIRVTIG